MQGLLNSFQTGGVILVLIQGKQGSRIPEPDSPEIKKKSMILAW
jgi:hypothetical protein